MSVAHLRGELMLSARSHGPERIAAGLAGSGFSGPIKPAIPEREITIIVLLWRVVSELNRASATAR
jgi:hypothetical protein